MVEWSHPRTSRRRKYQPLLEEVKEQQASHGTAWAEIARFVTEQSGRSCAYQLNQKYGEEGFEFKSSLDTNTQQCVVYARYGQVADDSE